MTELVGPTLTSLLFVPADPSRSSRQSTEDRACGSHRGCGHVSTRPPASRIHACRPFDVTKKACNRRRVHTYTKRTITPATHRARLESSGFCSDAQLMNVPIPLAHFIWCRSALTLVSDANFNRGLPMPKCTDGTIEFGRLGRRVIEANFEGGDIGWTAECCLLRGVDERIWLEPRGGGGAAVIRAIRRASRTACATCWPSASTACAAATKT